MSSDNVFAVLEALPHRGVAVTLMDGGKITLHTGSRYSFQNSSNGLVTKKDSSIQAGEDASSKIESRLDASSSTNTINRRELNTADKVFRNSQTQCLPPKSKYSKEKEKIHNNLTKNICCNIEIPDDYSNSKLDNTAEINSHFNSRGEESKDFVKQEKLKIYNCGLDGNGGLKRNCYDKDVLFFSGFGKILGIKDQIFPNQRQADNVGSIYKSKSIHEVIISKNDTKTSDHFKLDLIDDVIGKEENVSTDTIVIKKSIDIDQNICNKKEENLNNKRLLKEIEHVKESEKDIKANDDSKEEYKAKLNVEVDNWIKSLPISLEKKEKCKELRYYLATRLVEDICKISSEHLTEEYVFSLINIIESYLNSMPMWRPNSKKDKAVFKRHILESILHRILDLHESIQTRNQAKTVKVFNENVIDKILSHIDFVDRIVNKDLILKYLEHFKINTNSKTKDKLLKVIKHYFRSNDKEKEHNLKLEIRNLLYHNSGIDSRDIDDFTNVVIDGIKKLIENKAASSRTRFVSENVIVFQSRTNIPNNNACTPTPKRKTSCCKLDSGLSEIKACSKTKENHKDEEQIYSDAVEKEIRKWIVVLPFDLRTEEDFKFREVMIKDLVDDVVDRKKYLQLQGSTSDEEELNHLRYQIFKWLLKCLPVESEKQFEPQVRDLMNKINDIRVPNMTITKHGNRKDVKMQENKAIKETDIIEDEISIWMNEQEPHIFKNNIHQTDKNIKDLAAQLKSQLSDRKTTEKAIERWLQQILEDKEHKNINEHAKDLRSRLDNIRVSQLKPPLPSEIELFESRVVDFTKEWLKDQVFYAISTDKEKADQERMMEDLTKNFLHTASILPGRPEVRLNLLTKDMKERLNKFPVENGNNLYEKYGENIIDQIAVVLIRLISDLEALQERNISKASFSKLETYINEWLSKLPLNITNEYEKRQLNNAKSMLIVELLRIDTFCCKLSVRALKNLTKFEIIRFLKQVPLHEDRQDEESFLEDCANKLLETVQQSPSSKQVRAKHANVTESRLPICEMDQPIDEKLQEIVKEYLNNFDPSETLTKEALTERFIDEFKKVDKVNECCTTKTKLNNDNFFKELEITKLISDWLKKLPLERNFNIRQNKNRVQLISKLSESLYKELYETESPNTGNVIEKWLTKLPILQGHNAEIQYMVKNFVTKLNELKSRPQCCDDLSTLSNNESNRDSERSNEQKLEDFVENFIVYQKYNYVFNDDLARDAYAHKLLKALKEYIRNLKTPTTKLEIQEHLMDVTVPGETTVQLFSLELKITKIINDWLKNLQTQKINDPKQLKVRTRLINNLTNFLTNIVNYVKHYPTYSYQEELVHYVAEWLNAVLIPGQDGNYPQIIMQLWDKVKVLLEEDGTIDQTKKDATLRPFNFEDELAKHYSPEKNASYDSFKENVPHSSSFNVQPTEQNVSFKPKTPSDVLYEAVDSWCADVVTDFNKENINVAKDELQQKVLTKISELNMNPSIYNDNRLYTEVLQDEVESILDKSVQNVTPHNKQDLVAKLAQAVVKANDDMKEISIGENYKQKLEEAVKNSMHKPESIETKAQIDLLKDTITEQFILENYDDGDEVVKSKNDSKVIKHLNRINNTPDRDADVIYSTIKSDLYKIPAPDKSKLALEVEEIKTKEVISEWFDGLPIPSTTNALEESYRNSIKTVLAKRLHYIENNDTQVDSKMDHEISKWLDKLPIQPGVAFNPFIKDLRNRLKTTANDRKINTMNESKSRDDYKERSQANFKENLANKSGNNTRRTSNIPGCCKNKPINPSTMICEAVQNWCHTIPLKTNDRINGEKLDNIKLGINLRIIMKIGELNSDDSVFYDNFIYNSLLEDEIDKLFEELAPEFPEIEPISSSLKSNLIEAINCIKPEIKSTKELLHYKKQLSNTISQEIGPRNFTTSQKAILDNAKEKLIDDYIEFSFQKKYGDNPNTYKAKAIDTSISLVNEMKNQNALDSTEDENFKANKIFCELSKINAPQMDSLKNDIEEIKLKKVLDEWLDNIPVDKNNTEDIINRSHIRNVLAKRLNEMEKDGYSADNEDRMKKEIEKCLNKIGVLNEDLVKGASDRLIVRMKITKKVRQLDDKNSASEDNPQWFTLQETNNPDVWNNSQNTPKDKVDARKVPGAHRPLGDGQFTSFDRVEQEGHSPDAGYGSQPQSKGFISTNLRIPGPSTDFDSKRRTPFTNASTASESELHPVAKSTDYEQNSNNRNTKRQSWIRKNNLRSKRWNDLPQQDSSNNFLGATNSQNVASTKQKRQKSKNYKMDSKKSKRLKSNCKCFDPEKLREMCGIPYLLPDSPTESIADFGPPPMCYVPCSRFVYF